MDKTTKMIAIACSVGAAIGAFIMLIVSWEYAWTGFLSGAAAGYLAYDFREVLRAIPKAWQQVIGTVSSEEFWEPLIEAGLWLLKKPFAHLMLGVIGLEVWDHLTSPVGEESLDLPTMMLVVALASFALLGGSFWLLMLFSRTINRSKFLEHFGTPSVNEAVDGVFKMPYSDFIWLLWNSAKFIVVSPYLLLKVLLLVLRAIHSDKRVLCGVDAGLGAAVGYFFLLKPNMNQGVQVSFILACALVGGVLGVLNWELVSKRWLHLDRPAPAKP